MIISYFWMMLLIFSTLGENCDDIKCAHVFDEVCGMAESKDGTQIIKKFQNICHMRKKACELQSFLEMNQVADELCNIKKMKYDNEGESRRVTDHSIVGAYQVCNHSCPTYCTDAYEPACSRIYYDPSNIDIYVTKVMINHCHIDLYSCSSGLNVTIVPLSSCYHNSVQLMFLQNLAAMKSLRLLDDGDNSARQRSPKRRKNIQTRYTKVADEYDKIALKEQLFRVVRRIFEKYRQGSE